ncbi:MAG: tRNA (adenosine(37)-N6)-threonylcarbamoyltransferase complex dimerization subunit type 1 TsaB [Verrucomicrobiota bacterium]|nr:tRNA (adenosine(37)-N6)-threonylcarbamoyltransferase complex dimerization subunit type 1 TsaB [Verrucomicrobiota bacterium]
MILGLEFSSAIRSAALLDGNVVIARVEASDHSAPVLLLERLFQQAELPVTKINSIIVGLGPGSYTGIRSSLALAQGWQLGRNIPVEGVSSAELIAFQAWHGGVRNVATVVIDAQRGDVYKADYEFAESGFRALGELAIMPANALSTDAKLIGPEATKWNVMGTTIVPDAAHLNQVLGVALPSGAANLLEPIYLRETNFIKAAPSKRNFE